MVPGRRHGTRFCPRVKPFCQLLRAVPAARHVGSILATRGSGIRASYGGNRMCWGCLVAGISGYLSCLGVFSMSNFIAYRGLDSVMHEFCIFKNVAVP